MLIQDEINNLNIPIITNKTEAKIKNLQSNKQSPGPDKFSIEYFQIFKEELTTIFLKLFHKIEKKGIFPTYFKKPVIPYN